MASFSVVSNISSANAQAHLAATSVNLNKALTRLSSGFRINFSGDDAAGLSVANAYRRDVTILNQGIRNANDALSTLQIYDGAAANISTLLDRLATLATQAASGQTSDESRITLNQEFQDILAEIQREATVANFTTNQGFSVFIQNTANAADGKISGTISAVSTTTLTLNGHVVTSQALAQSAVLAVASAVTVLGKAQGTIGTMQNRLSFAINLAQAQVVNNRAAESRIRDANIAEESAAMTRYNILTQSGIAALAQANQTNQAVLQLLR
ncbi:MAG: flagellin [Acidobacteriota bacterium]